MNNNDKIFVAGHKGLAGSAILRELKSQGYTNILTVDKSIVDLSYAYDTDIWFQKNKPDYVFLAAAKVGGIHANDIYPVDFLDQNLKIQKYIYENYTGNPRSATHTTKWMGCSWKNHLGISQPKH